MMPPRDCSGVPSPAELGQAFPFIDEDRHRILQPYTSLCELAAGGALLTVDGTADALFVLLVGQLAVRKESGFGRGQVIALLSPPAVVGEAALGSASTSHHCLVEAVVDVRLLRLPASAFRKLAGDHPDLAVPILQYLLRVVSLRLEKCSTRLTHIL